MDLDSLEEIRQCMQTGTWIELSEIGGKLSLGVGRGRLGRVAGSRQQEISVGIIHRQSFLVGRLTPRSGLGNLVPSWLALVCGCLNRFTASVYCGLLRRDLAMSLTSSQHLGIQAPGSVSLLHPQGQLNEERQVFSQASGNLDSGQQLVSLGRHLKRTKGGIGDWFPAVEKLPPNLLAALFRREVTALASMMTCILAYNTGWHVDQNRNQK